MTRHEDRFVVRSRVTRELPGKICERLHRHTRASVKFKLSGTVNMATNIHVTIATNIHVTIATSIHVTIATSIHVCTVSSYKEMVHV